MDYPDDRFKEVSHKYRPIGLGFMGLADAMFMLDIKYNSQHGRDFVASITKAMTRASVRQSAILAKLHGKFEDYDVVKGDIEEILTKLLSPIGVEDQKVIDLVKQNGLRNCQHTTVAPTGTTALSCDTSYGIEPCFGLVWRKNLITGDVLTLINPVFERRFKGESWWTTDLLDKIAANNGSLKNIRGIPKEVKNIFVVAHDISPKDRVEFQASCQQHLSSAISSTVNLPHDASVEDVKEIFQLAYDLGLKGITIYRDGTKKGQPVTFKTESGVAISNFVRPSGLPAIKHCMQLADEKLYVDVVKYQGKIVEIWMEYGQAGHEVNIILKD
jgi:ribonucleoside-diphosphate reductase alpha chain